MDSEMKNSNELNNSEISENLEEAEKLCKIEPIQHTPGNQNPVYIATRDLATSVYIQPDSEWFRGPTYLEKPGETWPMSTDFLERKDSPIIRDVDKSEASEEVNKSNIAKNKSELSEDDDYIPKDMKMSTCYVIQVLMILRHWEPDPEVESNIAEDVNQPIISQDVNQPCIAKDVKTGVSSDV